MLQNVTRYCGRCLACSEHAPASPPTLGRRGRRRGRHPGREAAAWSLGLTRPQTCLRTCTSHQTPMLRSTALELEAATPRCAWDRATPAASGTSWHNLSVVNPAPTSDVSRSWKSPHPCPSPRTLTYSGEWNQVQRPRECVHCLKKT